MATDLILLLTQILALTEQYKQQNDFRSIGAVIKPETSQTTRAGVNHERQMTCNRNSLNLSHVIEVLLHKYDKHLLPHPFGVNVTMEIHVQEISSISELTSDFELDLMYSEIWYEPRLNFRNMSICATNITLKSQFRDRLWSPDTCIINSKSAEIHKSPSENMFVIIYEDGMVWSNYRMKVKAPCRLDLKMFPFDHQECSLVFESYSYNKQEVQLAWHGDPVAFINPVDLPDFELKDFTAIRQTLEYPNGLWDELKVTFTFSRRYGFYLFQVYFPTTLTVISSWVGFFLDARSVSARITLGVSSLLALTFQFGTVLKHLPRVSYIKSLDIWMLVCVCFVFFTLIELAIISQLLHRQRERELGSQVCKRWLEMVRAKKRVLSATNSNGEKWNGNGNMENRTANGTTMSPEYNRTAQAIRRAILRNRPGSPADSSLSPSAQPRLKIPQQVTQINANLMKFKNDWVKRSRSGSCVPAVAPISPLCSPSSPSPVPFENITTVRITKNTEKDTLLPKSKSFLCPNGFLNFKFLNFKEMRDKYRRWFLTAQTVDYISLFLFPIAFAIFNAIYWPVYFLGVRTDQFIG